MQKEEALRRIQDAEASSGDDFKIPDGDESDKEKKEEEAAGQMLQGQVKRALQSDSSSSEE